MEGTEVSDPSVTLVVRRVSFSSFRRNSLWRSDLLLNRSAAHQIHERRFLRDLSGIASKPLDLGMSLVAHARRALVCLGDLAPQD